MCLRALRGGFRCREGSIDETFGKARVELTLSGSKGSGRLTGLLVNKGIGRVKTEDEAKDDWEVIALYLN